MTWVYRSILHVRQREHPMVARWGIDPDMVNKDPDHPIVPIFTMAQKK